jgi:acetyl esterase
MAYVHPETAAFLAFLASANSPGLTASGPEAGRLMFEKMAALADRPAPAVAFTDTAFPGPGGTVPVRIYTPLAHGSDAPVMIYFHGGGWVIGGVKTTHHSLCATMAEVLGMTLVSVDYRLAPEHPFPAAVDDCLAAADWVAGNPSALGHKVSGIALAGDSAGGNLAAVVAHSRAAALPLLGQLLFYPAVDLTATDGSILEFGEGHLLTTADMTYFTASYADGADMAGVRLSPLNADSLAGQPPAVVMTCNLDPLRDQGRAYAARLIGDGVRTSYHDLPGHIHGAMNLRGAVPSAHAHLLAVLGDFKQVTGA